MQWVCAVALALAMVGVVVGGNETASANELPSEEARAWARAHDTGEALMSRWSFAWMRIELPERVNLGDVVEARLKAGFDAKRSPPGRLPVRVIWDTDGKNSLVSETVFDACVAPGDTLSVAVQVRVGGPHLGIGCSMFLEHVVDGAAVRGSDGFNQFTKDYWWYAGEAENTRGPNPLAPRELIPEDEAYAIEKRLLVAFEEKLEEAKTGAYGPPAEARAVIDSMLPEAAEVERRQLAYVAEYLAAEAKEPVSDAAWFVSNQAVIFARGQGKDQTEGARSVLAWANKDAIMLLQSQFRDVQRERHHPSWALWEGFRRAQGGVMTWDGLEELVNRYENAYSGINRPPKPE